MRPVLFVQNDPYETFGVGIGAMADAGLEVTVWRAIAGEPRPDLDTVSGVVVFGGSCNVDDHSGHPFLADVKSLTREAVDRKVPVLGICLGAQVLARALDRAVPPSPVREVGFEPVRPTEAAADDVLLSHMSDGDMHFQWHQDTVELPEGAVVLATGDRVPVQAFRVGDRAWGVQFHLEVDRAEVGWWLDVYADKGGDIATSWGKSEGAVRSETERFMDGAEDRGREVFTRFAKFVEEVSA